MSLSRRTLLTAGAALPLTGLPLPARATGPSSADFRALDAALTGTVERRGTSAYDSTRRLNDPRYDRIKPPAIARCASNTDVTEVINFARRFGMPVVPRGGGQFGVVTGWRMRTFDVTTVGSFVLSYPWKDAAAVAAGWQARLSAAPDETWSTCQFAADPKGRRTVRISGFVLGGDPGPEVDAIVAAIGREPSGVTLDRRAYLDVVRDRGGCDSSGDCGDRETELVGSDVFPDVLPPGAVAAVLAVVEKRAKARKPGVAKLKRMTGAPSRLAPDATAFPWRNAYTMMQWLVKPAKNDRATVKDAYAWIDRGHRAVAAFSAGRYVNYIEPSTALLPRYYGANLRRLRKVRAIADPDRLFRSPYAL